MTGGYGGTAVCTKGTTSLPVFNDYNYGQASVARRIYWYPESVLFDNTLLWSIYEMYTANGDCIPKYIYGVKI